MDKQQAMRKNSKIKEGIFPKLTLFNTTDISSKKSRHGLRSIGIVRNAGERASEHFRHYSSKGIYSKRQNIIIFGLKHGMYSS